MTVRMITTRLNLILFSRYILLRGRRKSKNFIFHTHKNNEVPQHYFGLEIYLFYIVTFFLFSKNKNCFVYVLKPRL